MKCLNWIAAALAALLAAPAAPALAQPQEIATPPGDWTPPGTQVRFPETIGMYERTSAYKVTEGDWAVGYNLYWGGKLVHAVTLYLYPRGPGGTCTDELTRTMTAITNARPNAVKGKLGMAPSPRGTDGVEAWTVRYTFRGKFAGTEQDLVSTAYLYCHPRSGAWIKMRATAPVSANRIDEAPAVLAGVYWPKDLVE